MYGTGTLYSTWYGIVSYLVYTVYGLTILLSQQIADYVDDERNEQRRPPTRLMRKEHSL
jgi:hypothetical protein